MLNNENNSVMIAAIANTNTIEILKVNFDLMIFLKPSPSKA